MINAQWNNTLDSKRSAASGSFTMSICPAAALAQGIGKTDMTFNLSHARRAVDGGESD
jgi:hypothetical protein